MRNSIVFILIGIVIGYLLFARGCDGGEGGTQIDTVYVTQIIKNPAPPDTIINPVAELIYRTDTVWSILDGDTVFIPVIDTARRYTQMYVDSMVTMEVEATVKGILERLIITPKEYRIPVKTITIKEEPERKAMVFLGATLTGGGNHLYTYGTASLLNKKNTKLFSVGYDPFSQSIQAGVSAKLGR